MAADALSDGFGRHITYLRLSVTDRCDLRCRYCMAERMTFLAPRDLLTLDELGEIAEAFVARGVRKIRLTGGEPLVRSGVIDLARRIGRLLPTGEIDELTLTTNGNHLADHACALRDAGLRRINVSLDTRDPERFRHITRWGTLDRVLDGIDAAKKAGLAVKINMVALKGFNEDEIETMLRWCGGQGFDLTLIETMPLGEVEEDRTDRYLPLDGVRLQMGERFTLTPLAYRTGGPARYAKVRETGTRIGFITPLTQNFCDGCNRMRLTASGCLYACLGHDDQVDLKQAFRNAGREGLHAAIDEALRIKPLRHNFHVDRRGAEPVVSRHMSATGG